MRTVVGTEVAGERRGWDGKQGSVRVTGVCHMPDGTPSACMVSGWVDR